MLTVDKSRIGLLIFDLDGTLADTIWSIRDGVNMSLKKYGFPERSYEEIRLAIGNGARELIRLSVPEQVRGDASLVNRVFSGYEEAYGKTFRSCDRCYDGMLDALTCLRSRGYRIAVLSNKQDAYVKELVKILLPEGMSEISMGQTELPRKPDPTVPLMIAKELGFESSNTAFIGDSEVDILTGKNAGMLTVGCAWGYRGGKLLSDVGADTVIDKPSELEKTFL